MSNDVKILESALRIAEEGLRDIAIGKVLDDNAAGEENIYLVCAGRLAAKARMTLKDMAKAEIGALPR